jgi:hypothetical protein
MVVEFPRRPTMSLKMNALFLCLFLITAVQARATVLPDACGDDKIKFEVTTKKGQPAPAGPAEGKAQIVFVETVDKTGLSFCIGCDALTRIGMDGAWVGANKGNSYFTLDVAPGEHHLCTGWQSVFRGSNKNVGMASFTAEAGKVYYFEAKVGIHSHQYGSGPGSSQETDTDLGFVQVSDDEGKYRVKASKLATWKINK